MNVVIWILMASGFLAAVMTYNWLALGWWFAAFTLWRYTCALHKVQDMTLAFLDDLIAALKKL